jgi:hypothetical protein
MLLSNLSLDVAARAAVLQRVPSSNGGSGVGSVVGSGGSQRGEWCARILALFVDTAADNDDDADGGDAAIDVDDDDVDVPRSSGASFDHLGAALASLSADDVCQVGLITLASGIHFLPCLCFP